MVDLTATRGAVLGALRIACAGVTGQACVGRSLFTVSEQRRGTTIVGLGANPRGRRPTPRPKTVATALYAIPARQSAIVSAVFDTAGKRLLAKFYTLPTALSSSGTAITPLAIRFGYPLVTGRPNSSWVTFSWAGRSCSFCWTSVDTVFFFGIPRLLPTATFRVTCVGASCPRPRTFGPRLHTLKLNSMFAGRKLGPGSTISLLITALDSVGRLITWQTVGGSLPVGTVKWIPPGAPRPTKCPAGV